MPPSASAPDARAQESQWLDSATKNVKACSFKMKRCLDEGNLRKALEHSAAMLGELRTSLLSPQKYYALYMLTFDELTYLEAAFRDENAKGRNIAEMYEMVQHAGNILPRMYLLITIGSIYLKTKQGSAREVLRDLVELSRGVQHPIRGLFVRTYLSQVTKKLLPDADSSEEEVGGTVKDSVDFILVNFTEMNKLWVRMQHQGPARDRERREQERQELRDLVGKNLLVLSQLEGVDLAMYKDIVLPRVLEQVVACKDEIAQPYLMDAIIQVFPSEFHLQTLSQLTSTCASLQANVKVASVISGLMTRLAAFAVSSSEVLAEFDKVGAFNQLEQAVRKIVETQQRLPTADLIQMHVALASFTMQVYPDKLDFVDAVLASCATLTATKSTPVSESVSVKQLIKLLSGPLETYSVVQVLSLSSYPKCMALLTADQCKEMALTIIRNLLKAGTVITELDQVKMLFEFMARLVRDTEDERAEEEDEADFAEEQNLVARLVGHLHNPDSGEQYRILVAVRKQFGLGGPRRLPFTLPPLTFAALKLAHQLRREGGTDQLKKVFQFLHQTLAALTDVPEQSELVFRLYLQTAQVSSSCSLEDITYEFLERAFEIYEEGITNSKSQVVALQLLSGTLERCAVFGPENRETLVHKAMGYCAKLLKKPDQCRGVYTCAHLFWSRASGDDAEEAHPATSGTGGHTVRDGDTVLVCLKRSLKIASAKQLMSSAAGTDDDGPITLFVEILNKYIQLHEAGCVAITADLVQKMVDLVRNEMEGLESGPSPQLASFATSTLEYASKAMAT
mmetsp:Transcript_9914/g.32483  ORF Transcript_9914/g.32483 Transcript_9914/m.32483 type:complete len:794 (+) Transcript_9914:2-2383(+)